MDQVFNSTGIAVTIGSEIVSVAYGAQVEGITFGVRFISETAFIIVGLTDSTNYTAEIAATNANGSGPAAFARFRTTSFADSTQ